MSKRVCPWWLGRVLAGRLRRWISDDPGELLAPYVREGMTVLEPGPGMGFFTLELARRVGPSGRVIAVDIQPKMLQGLERRALKAGVRDRIEVRLVPADSMRLSDVAGTVDFTLAFAVVHEMPDTASFFAQVAAASKRGARVLLAEPVGHVNAADFQVQLGAAARAGFCVLDRPRVRRSHAVLLEKNHAPS